MVRDNELPGHDASQPVSVNKEHSVNKSNWHPCGGCGERIPVVYDWHTNAQGVVEKSGTYSYVCPHCGHCHAQAIVERTDVESSDGGCPECGLALSDGSTCPNLAIPANWIQVDCPHCSHSQHVHAPHLPTCDAYHLECVQCERVFDSLCVC